MKESAKNILIDEISKNMLQKETSKGEISRDVIDNFAKQEREQSMHISQMVRGNLANLENRDKPVFDALTSLQETINDLNPNNFEISFFDKIFGGAKNKMRKYFQKFKSNENMLNELVSKLESSKEILERDNIALDIEAKQNVELSKKLQIKLDMAQEANAFIESILNQDSNVEQKSDFLKSESLDSKKEPDSINTESKEIIPITETTHSYDNIAISAENKLEVQNKILFPLKQKIMDFQQQILVHTQGAIALKTLINNNKELINSVERTKGVTLNALNVAIITAQGLEQQQRVLKAVQDINTQTSELIAHTGAKLKEQGTQIQKGASSAMLDMEKLKSAFNDVISAMEDVRTFKAHALPKMQEDINLYNKCLDDMRRGERV